MLHRCRFRPGAGGEKANPAGLAGYVRLTGASETGRARAGTGASALRVGEAVADGDHTLQARYLVDDTRAKHDACRSAFQRDDPIVHGHREPVRIGEEPVSDHVLSDLAADFLVGPAEHA